MNEPAGVLEYIPSTNTLPSALGARVRMQVGGLGDLARGTFSGGAFLVLFELSGHGFSPQRREGKG